MTKKMRRFLALVLALVLCAGQLAIPVSAAEEDENTAAAPEVTVDVVVTPVEGGTQTTTTTTTTSSDAGAGTTSNSTVTEVVTVTGGGTQTNVNTTWTSTDTQTSGSTTAGNPTVVTDTNVVTTTTGSEDSSQTVTYSGNTEITEGSLSGQETTDTIGTTITTTTTTGEYLYDKEDKDEPVEETLPNGTNTSNSGWTKVDETDNAWTKVGDMQPGIPDPKNTETETSSETVTIDVPKAPNVTLEMDVPTGEATETVDEEKVTWDDVLAGLAEKPDATDDNVTVLEYDGEGNPIKWEVTYDPVPTPDMENPTEGTPAPQINENTDEDGWAVIEIYKPVIVTVPKYEEAVVAEPVEKTEGNITTIVKTEKIVGEDGTFRGYKVTTTTIEKTNNEDNRVVTESDDPTITIPGTEQPNGFDLPDRPEESSTSNSYGGVTEVTVTDLMEGDDHVGYTITTNITDKNGEVIRTETKNIYGTTHTIKTDEEQDPTTEKTATYTTITTTNVEEIYTTESTREMQRVQNRTDSYNTEIVTESDIYQLITTDDGQYFLYKGVMYQVTGTNKVESSTVANGSTVLMTGYKSSDDLRIKNAVSAHPKNEGKLISDNYTGQIFGEDTKKDGSWTYVGNGLYSTYMIRDNTEVSQCPQQFMIKDGDQIQYVYCVEMGTPANGGTDRDSKEYTVDNADATTQKLMSVAQNGFWGTASGTGSLGAVKALMQANGVSQDYIDNLTAGMAVAATQAALWTFTNDEVFTASEIIGNDSAFETSGVPTEIEKNTIIALKDLLVNLANTSSQEKIETITTESITGSSITIKNAVTKSDEAETDETTGATYYNTDVVLSLSVTQSSLTGNLVLTVMQGGETVRTVDIATEGSNVLGKIKAKGKEVGSTITLTDLELMEGVNVTLKLSGVQNLNDTIVIYKDDTLQDFLGGLNHHTNTVDISVNLKFEVADPKVIHTDKTVTEHRVDTQAMVKTDTRIDKMTSTETKTSGTKVTEKTYDIDVYGTVTVTETKKDITKENRTWKENWKFLRNIITSEDTDTQDEEIILADAPKTGDVTALLAVVSGLSLGGMVLLRKRKEEE